MSTTYNIVLVHQDKRLKEKNFIIEDNWMATFQTGVVKSYFTTDIPILHKLNLEIIVPLSDTYLEMGGSATLPQNYCAIRQSIDNVGKKWYFYWITNYEWMSESAIKLYLRMDTINTFIPFLDSFTTKVDWTFKANTLVEREHKDRWKKIPNTTTFVRNIDKESEDNASAIFKTYEETIEGDYQKWYLLYKNKEAIDVSHLTQVNPVETQVIPEYNLSYYTSAGYLVDTGVVNTSANGVSNRLSNQVIYVIDGTQHEVYYGRLYSEDNFIRFGELYTSGGVTSFRVIEVRKKGNSWISSEIFNSNLSSIKHIHTELYGNTLPKVAVMSAVYTDNTEPTFINEVALASASTTSREVLGIKHLDRSNSKLIKCIELPYCPIELSDNWDIEHTTSEEGLVLFEDNTLKYDLYIEGASTFFKDELEEITTNPLSQAQNIKYESKLLHSDYKVNKLVYDSYSQQMKNEYINWASFGGEIDITMITSSNYSSCFMFENEVITYYYEDGWKNEDYQGYLVISRNNDLSLYNSQYVNYMRNGYSFDVKARQQQTSTGWLKLGLNVLGSVASFATGGLIGGLSAPLKAVAQVGAVAKGVTGVSSGVASLITNAMESQRVIDEKIAQAQAQAVSIQGADDLSLLDRYTAGNKAKIVTYECSPKMKQLAYMKMLYYGYKTNEMKIPDINTRWWWNFLQCELEMDTYTHIPEEIIADIKAKYKEGVTFIHKRVLNGTNSWDLAQVSENWELTIVNTNWS